MNERVQDSIRQPAKAGDSAPTLRPVDAFVVGGEVAWESGQNLWLMLSRPGERLIDFFLEDDEVTKSRDPAPCACAGVLPDGTLMIEEVDWEMDRFLSELLDDQENSAAR
jgi:hypothetical protein